MAGNHKATFRMSLEERFWMNIGHRKDCWEWDGPLNDDGAGFMHHHNKKYWATRLSFWVRNGAEAPRVPVRHTCGTPRCVNPDHLVFETDPTQRIIGRFMAKVQKLSNGCWRWTGCKMKQGYGRFNLGGLAMQAHRVAKKIFGEEVSEGLDLHHTCSNKWCVNPSHLVPMTRAEHLREEHLISQSKCAL